ncbi:MAG: YncE family protein [Deltaproteobacteria bacterium]|nr:YncE family protein [Deltaproteobacteria bacterium]
MTRLAWLLSLAVLVGCGDEAPVPGNPWTPRSLDPVPNPFGPDEPLWAPQPHRERPRAAVLSSDESKLYVAMQGREEAPSHVVAVVDVARGAVTRRIRVGRAPVALALHPEGRFLVVANLHSNFASIVDTRSDEVVAQYPVPFYTTAIAFSPDGARAYLANRWKDSLLSWDLRVSGGRFDIVADDYRAIALDSPMGSPVGTNPDQVSVDPESGRVYVSSIAGGRVHVYEPDGDTLVGVVSVRSPVGGMALVGDYLVLTHIGHGTGHEPTDGVDGDEDGAPGDGTGNVMFQDLQNELEVYDTRTLESVGLYTSDSLCCFDYRDVDPDDPTRGMRIPAPETWPAERAALVPPRDTWIVAGALPTRIARVVSPRSGSARLFVIMAASNEAQRFDLDLRSGRLSAVDTAASLYRTGAVPTDVVANRAGTVAYVVDRLGESVTVLDATSDTGGAGDTLIVGDVSGGAFPASDVELGELFNNVTAPLTVDGDQSCVHCHREGGNLDRLVAMPLQTNRTWGSRQIQAYRGAFDTRPWFIEAAMDEGNFFPVLNEFNRKENFCCEGLDSQVWSRYPDVPTCVAEPDLEGCNHVLRCDSDPPSECADRPYGSPYATRDAFLQAAAERLTGRRTTFGDALRIEGTDRPLPLTFDAVTRALGLFLLAEPRLPPNPNQPLETAAAARGRLLYERAEVGCATCHPLPITTIASAPAFSPAGLPVRLPPVITPTLAPDGSIADTVTQGFRDTFTVATIGSTEQGPEGMHIGIPQVRGIWDRADRFYHDGRARSLREALLTPNHPALLPGEHGFNERYGVIDTHGGTSQLTPEQVDDLIAFLRTL